MRFLYQYRTKDNELRNGEIAASDRDAAFAVLRASGIRPARLEEAPGFFNKLFGKGKRWLVIGVLVLGLAAAIVHIASLASENAALANPSVEDRQQIYGDPGVLAEIAADGFAGVFADSGDRFLARFAQPAAPVDATVKPPERISTDLVQIAENDIAEVAKLKRIVNGMKLELAEYCRDGGTVAGYCRRLAVRQRDEADTFARYRTELSRESSREVWTRRNAELRAAGLPMVQFDSKNFSEKNLKIPR